MWVKRERAEWERRERNPEPGQVKAVRLWSSGSGVSGVAKCENETDL